MEPVANNLRRPGIAAEEVPEEKDRLRRQDHYSESGNFNQERNPDHEFNHRQDGHGQSDEDDDTPAEEKNQLETTKAEMCRVSAENQRLKLHLDEMLRDYKTLHSQYLNVFKQGNDKATPIAFTGTKDIYLRPQSSPDRESDIVSLSLGIATSSSSGLKKEREKIDKPLSKNPEEGNVDTKMILVHSEEDEMLKLGLECKFEEANLGIVIEESTLSNLIPTSSTSTDLKEDELGETWPTSKFLKTTRSGDNEVPGQNNNNPVKKARVSVRARCDTPTMNDGCQWRKYGQKIAKGNPCPRAYYRCTTRPSCPVRKQVQRCADDMSILITTYEETHNHPLPMSATAMASTTSVAAQMLLSGSSSSTSHQVPLTTAASSLLSYLPPETLRPSGPKGSPFYLTTALSSGSCPTITLNLTSSNPSSSSSSTHLFTRFNPSTYSTTYSHPILSSSSSSSMRPFSSTSTLSFDPSSSDTIPTALPITSWGCNRLLSYGTASSHQENNNTINNTAYQSYLQRNNISSASASASRSMALPDTIEAATEAITGDPNFQSMLAAALKSIISSENGTIGHASSGGTQ